MLVLKQFVICVSFILSLPLQVTQVVLVIGKRAYPIGRRKRQSMALRVEVEHRHRLGEGCAPGVTYEPPGQLCLCGGDKLHKTALMRLREGFGEVLVDAVHLNIRINVVEMNVEPQALPVQKTPFALLHDLHFRQHVLDKGRKVGHLSGLFL